MFAWSVFILIAGRITLRYFVVSQAPHVIMGAALLLGAGPLRTVVEHNQREYHIVMQVASFALNMWTRAVSSPVSKDVCSDMIQQHRIYIFVYLTMVYFVACCGYVPDRYYYGCMIPVLFVSWVCFHVRIGFMNPSVVVVGFCSIGLMSVARLFIDDLHRKSFFAAAELQQAQRNLEQVLLAKQSMLSTLFDASCICNRKGQISTATPQMTQVLTCPEDALRGREFSQLAASERERERLLAFVEAAWDSADLRTTMIQTSLTRPPLPDAGAPASTSVAGGDVVELKVYCTRLPGGDGSGASEDPGLFMGMQEVTPGCGEGAAEAGGRAGAGADAHRAAKDAFESAGTHSIIFDAGEPALDVLDWSPIFGDRGEGEDPHSLLDFLPRDAAKEFDTWVYDEVQAAPEGQPSRSTHMLRSLALNLPHVEGIRLTARRAWLEFGGFDGMGDAIPVALQLSGLCVKVAAVGKGSVGQTSCATQRDGGSLGDAQKFSVEPIEELDEDQNDDLSTGCGGDNDSDGHSQCDGGESSITGAESSIMPDDSASQFVCFRLASAKRRQRG